MPTKKPTRLKYAKPKIRTVKAEKQYFGTMIRLDKGVVKYTLPDGREFYSRQYGFTAGHKLQWELYKAGVPVEIPFEARPKGKIKLMGYFGAGKTVFSLSLEKVLSTEQKENIARQMVNILAELHKRKIEHHHPHSKNWVVDKFGKVRLIDFKSAARKQVNWENQNSILENFNKDYKTLKDSFRIILNIKGPMLENLFNTLVSKYPCSEQVKTAILDQILSL